MRTKVLLALALLAGCGDRDAAWDAPLPPAPRAYGLEGSVALVDEPAGRLVVVSAGGDLEARPRSVPIEGGFVDAAASSDGARLFVLARGDVPRRSPSDRPPTVQVVGGRSGEGPGERYVLSDPLSSLAVDPSGRFVVAYPSGKDVSFVQNPNELIVIDADRPAAEGANPTPVTLRSFGGRPRALSFTPPLGVPGGPRRLLVVQTEQDLALVDLEAPAAGEITVRLTTGGAKLSPAGVAVSDGEAGKDDARIAVRLEGDPNVVVLSFEQSAPGSSQHAFRPVPNVVAAGGVPSDLAFVRTDAGERLAALVPSRGALTLADTVTGVTSEVELGAAFDRMSLVTDELGEGGGGDVALVWSTSAAEVALVRLGITAGTPYRSVERLALATPVASVRDVPGANRHCKLLASSDGRDLAVLDLVARTASPLVAARGNTALSVSPDGERAWVRAQGSAELALVDLASLHPRNLLLDRPIDGAFEIARPDGGPALVAVHPYGAITLLDARAPDPLAARHYAGFLLGGLP
ncbi:MAG TPA: hypothetical protein VFS43_18255 [Polyangiaceae bacterium]|nr:hypothetical protein [Polyangiaceae bacterium]